MKAISNISQMFSSGTVTNTNSSKNSVSNPSFSNFMNQNTNGKKNDITPSKAPVMTNKKMSSEITVKDSKVTADAAVDQVKTACEQMTETVKEKLKLTTEELEKIMAEMGIGAMDLLNPNVLMQLVLSVNGVEDASQLLIDANLTDTLADLTDSLSEILENADLSFEMVEDVKGQLDTEGDFDQSLKSLMGESKSDKVKTDDEMNEEEENSSIPEVTVEKEVTAKEADRNSRDNESSEQSKDTKTSNFNTIINGLNESVMNKVNAFDETMGEIEDMQSIVTQVVDQIKVKISADTTSMEMVLNPEQLGKVNLNVAAKDGVLSAQISVENEMTKRVLENQIQILKDSLNEQGLKVEAVEVTVADMSFNSSNSASSSDEGKESKGNRKKITLEESEALEKATDEEILLNEAVPDLGNSVNYTA